MRVLGSSTSISCTTSGPFATALLADLGADVVKVEHPRTGDDYRAGPAPPGETSLSFQNTNRGKRSITLDVRTDDGRELFLRLAERADVVVENFRAGWMERRGLGPAAIQARSPRCIVASLSGFGQTGPYAGRASYDVVAQATGGLMAMTGWPDGPPTRGGGALGDYVGALFLALGIAAALVDRERTGRARVLDLSNQDAIFALTDSMPTLAAGIGAATERLGNDHPFATPYGAFEARDGWVVIATASNRLFRALCAGIGRPELASDERFRRHDARARHREELHAVFRAWVAERTVDEVLQALGPDGADVPVARVERPEELVRDPQLVARGMIERHPHPTLGEILFTASPLRFTDAAPRARALAPALGCDGDDVYAELGLDAEALRGLRERGVI